MSDCTPRGPVDRDLSLCRARVRSVCRDSAPSSTHSLPIASRLLLTALVAALASQTAQAQRWRPIGQTVTGSSVFIDPSSVSKKDSIITATVRVVFKEPTPTPKGPITGSRAIAMFNCERKTVAVKENIIWHDERLGTIYEKRTPKQPGFGPVFSSNFSGVALTYLCTPAPVAAPASPRIPASPRTPPTARTPEAVRRP